MSRPLGEASLRVLRAIDAANQEKRLWSYSELAQRFDMTTAGVRGTVERLCAHGLLAPGKVTVEADGFVATEKASVAAGV